MPYPVLAPHAPLGTPVVVGRIEPRLVAEQIAAITYRSLGPKTHLSPQLMGGASRIPLPGAGPPNSLHRSAVGTQQSLGTRTSQQMIARPLVVTTGTADPDGINHWWTYEEDALGGVGKYMINIANGNLITQSDDMSVPNKRIEFAFRRTYNSMSNHTYANGDGSTPSLYGDRWTNTFDAHIAYNNFTPVNGQQGVSVFDIDGARYDYAPIGDGHTFTPPAGQFAILYYDGTGYSWTKKSGTVYYFWDVKQTSNLAGFAGQIETIYGRNHNNYLSFTRSYTNGDASKATNLASIVATAEDGRTSTLTFGDISQNGSPNYRVLQTLTWPDGTTTATYAYTIQFQGTIAIGPVLTKVTNPSNSTTIVEQYNYTAGTASLSNVYSPNYVNTTNSGPAYAFVYGTGATLAQVQYFGDVNPQLTDASGTGYLQPNATHDLGTTTPYRTASLTYSTGSTTWSDTDGHQTVYSVDSVGRVTQTAETTGDPSGGVTTLTSTAGWDSSNDLTFTTDPRGNETDIAYDNNGNTIEVAKPAASTSVNGTVVTMRATSVYSYDANNNVTAYCDPVWVHANGKDWTSRPAPSDSLCPGQSGTTILSWAVPGSYEPFGELTQLTKPMGFQSTFAYATAPQGGADFGLPTSVTGASFTESDGTHVTPLESFVYDAHGNVVCYSNGVGTWIVQYDALSRRIAVGDPDDASLTSSSCSKTPGIASSHIQMVYNYLPNGQISSTLTPGEYYAGAQTNFYATKYTYDGDGDVTSVIRYYGGNSGTTTKVYDGADRLVETVIPYDSTIMNNIPVDYLSYPWTSRNLYDLTQGGQPNLNALTGQTLSVTAHGGLFATTLWAGTYNGNGGVNSPAWWATKAYAHDALDRQTQRYIAAPSTTGFVYNAAPSYAETLSTYDTNSLFGLLATASRMPLAGSVVSKATYSYDADSRQTQVIYSDSTPSETYAYDPDDRSVSIQSSQFGALAYTYDSDGREVTESEPSSGGITSAAQYKYYYYPNGWRQSVDVTSSGLTQTSLFLLSYRADGNAEQEKFAYSGNTSTFSFTYTLGGRTLTLTDPFYNPAHSFSYDSAGHIASYHIPSMQLSETYDPEDDTTQMGTSSYNYDLRGEQYYGTVTGQYQTADGAHYPMNDSLQRLVPDPVTGVVAASLDLQSGYVDNNQYDSLGRLSEVRSKVTYKSASGPATWTVTGYDTRSYDGEDHLTGSSYATWPCAGSPPLFRIGPDGWPGKSVTLSYGWGPNGHPIYTTGSGPSGSYNETLHWMGNTLLFTTNNSGQVDDLKIGALAEIVPRSSVYSGLTVLDRDLNGRLLAAHNSTGYGSWESVSIFANWPAKTGDAGTCDNPDGKPAPFGMPGQIEAPTSQNYKVAAPPVAYEPMTDAVSDGHSGFHGAREISGETGTWSTPDAFDGIIGDPISQRSYLYDRNNPVSYADPSGFIPQLTPNGFPDDPEASGPGAKEFGASASDIAEPDYSSTIADLSLGGATLVAFLETLDKTLKQFGLKAIPRDIATQTRFLKTLADNWNNGPALGVKGLQVYVSNEAKGLAYMSKDSYNVRFYFSGPHGNIDPSFRFNVEGTYWRSFPRGGRWVFGARNAGRRIGPFRPVELEGEGTGGGAWGGLHNCCM